jgi:hypothetical protein
MPNRLSRRNAEGPRSAAVINPARVCGPQQRLLRGSWLAAFLVFSIAATTAQVPRQRRPAGSGSYSFSVSVTHIGDAAIETSPQPAGGLKTKVAYYYANRREIVSGNIAGSAPPGMSVHPLVRREGADKWEVLTAALRTGGGGRGSGWKAEVRFGNQADEGGNFELRVVASREPLPVGGISFDILSRNALSMSDLIRVRRRIEGAAVWLAYVNNTPVYGNELIDVHVQAPVEVRARAVPPETRIGVAVQPVKPWTDHHWIMEETVVRGGGHIVAHFGRVGLDDFHEFEVLAFVAWEDDFPPRGIGIQQAAWEKIENKFVAKSRVVRVIRWEGEFKIIEIDGKRVSPQLVLPVDAQSDIAGAVSRPLAGGQKVWIICLPKGGEPWVAGWTDELHSAGRWVVNAAQLRREGQPKLIDVVAVIATEDPTKVSPQDLRQWIYQGRRPKKTVRVLVTGSAAR